jgi:glycosyltransferase involved in cell wall biosynthesis
MKVLHVIDSGGLYGAEQVLLTLMSETVRSGAGVALASIATPGLPEKPLEKEARRRGLDVRRETMGAGADLRAAAALASAARASGFDLVHTHGYKANTLIAGQPRRRRGLPAVATLHGWTASTRFSRMGLYQMVERIALRSADRVVAVSDAMAARWGLRGRYGERLRIIHNGVTAGRASPGGAGLPDRFRGFVAGRPSIFAAGRLSREKGFDVLVDALAMLRGGGVDACLVLAGDGELRGELAARIEARALSDAVQMPGYLPDSGSLMPHFDVLAIPSRSEGLPIVLLEALLAGVPVAATAVGEIPAVLSSCDAGGCAAPGDASSLAARLRALLTQPPDGERLDAIARRAAQRYSAGSMASAYRSLYEELLSTR